MRRLTFVPVVSTQGISPLCQIKKVYSICYYILYFVFWHATQPSIHCQHFTARQTFKQSIKLQRKDYSILARRVEPPYYHCSHKLSYQIYTTKEMCTLFNDYIYGWLT